MRVAVVGGGLAGLAAAQLLTAIPGIEVTVIEASSRLGGRANVTGDGGEHCPRFFLRDYHMLFALLSEIPWGPGSVADRLVLAKRLAPVDGEWLEIDHLYLWMARNLSVRQKLNASRAHRASLLVAKRSVSSSNRFGAAANYSLRTVVSGLIGFLGARDGFVLPGCTEEQLIAPWARELRRRGVAFWTGAPVRDLRLAGPGGSVEVRTDSTATGFDAVLVTAFAHDAYALMDRSGLVRRLDWRQHTHSACFTVDLDPAEPVLRDPSPRVYARDGVSTLVQPAAARCVALLTMAESTSEAFALAHLREVLGLRFAPRAVRCRENLAPGEAVFIGDYVDPAELERDLGGRVLFCGSYTANSYPVDSAEGAVRSAAYAVERLLAAHPAGRAAPPSALAGHEGLPSPVTTRQRAGATRALAHPNAPRNPRLSGALWRSAVGLSRATAALAAEIDWVDVSGRGWPLGEPAIYVANHRSVFDVVAGLLTFDRLRVHPHLVVAEKYFRGTTGRMLEAIGALPALRGSDATLLAAEAAVLAGSSVAFMPEGRLTARAAAGPGELGRGAFAVAAMTGAPIVPIAGAGTERIWPDARPRLPLRRGRQRVRVVVGEPIRTRGVSAEQLRLLLWRRLGELESLAAAPESRQATETASLLWELSGASGRGEAG